MERPWKAFSAATIPARPVRRASLKQPSIASVPEFARNTADPAGASRSSSSRSARATCGVVVNRFETWPSVANWAVMAETRNGCACPSTFTAMPASRSR